MDKKIYIAGSLFNQAEVNQRLFEGQQLRDLGFTNIYNPIEAPVNDKAKLPTAADIFDGDTQEILDADIIIADLSNQADLGVACEMGIVWCCNMLQELAKVCSYEEILDIFKAKKVVAHLSDIRKGTAHRYTGNNIPVGFNQYLIGCVESIGSIKDNFDEVLDELKKERE